MASASSRPTRHDWAKSEIQEIYNAPLLDLVYRAASVHRQHHDPTKIQLCTLMNIKTGGCTEDCSYCSQSSKYSTPTKASRLVEIEPVLEAARKAKENGSTRFCMGAAWRDLAGRKRGFEKILTMVREVRGMGMEVCTTLGMLSPEQARQLKEAGLTAYNHNLDTSREFYPTVITTRSYDERLDTISAVRNAGISVCSGGILGLGESDADRVGLIWEVSSMPEHPESFPVNALVPIPGTPLEDNEPVAYHTLLRTIATARIVLPTTIIRLAAGRQTLDESKQAMCFMAGANAVFTGEQMLTTPCSPWDEDKTMMARWGLDGMRSFEQTNVAKKEGSRLSSSTPTSSAKVVPTTEVTASS
ncbi:biotin synthase [Irpex rosettiformis]|uniref:Biotin synthase n=1 Tax=Irpex rosettiformis TaxID=378272 RepID=A0ACB8UJH1_9APHY|nr:biotin synthase [Irpex rosettiformis]